MSAGLAQAAEVEFNGLKKADLDADLAEAEVLDTEIAEEEAALKAKKTAATPNINQLKKNASRSAEASPGIKITATTAIFTARAVSSANRNANPA